MNELEKERSVIVVERGLLDLAIEATPVRGLLDAAIAATEEPIWHKERRLKALMAEYLDLMRNTFDYERMDEIKEEHEELVKVMGPKYDDRCGWSLGCPGCLERGS